MSRKSWSKNKRPSHRLRLASGLAAIMWSAVFALAGGRVVSDELELEWSARALTPGEVISCKILAPPQVVWMTARMFGKEFPAFRSSLDGSWRVLVGIDLGVQPGRHVLEVQARSTQRETRALQAVFYVQPKEFPVRRIQVEERYVEPPPEELERIRREQELVRRIFAELTPEPLWDGEFLVPVPGEVISAFGKRSIINGQPRSPHSGVDLRGAAGTPVKAPNRGRVVLARELYFSGNTVILDHGLGLFSYFAHLSSFDVAEGDLVEKGAVVGRVGATGRVTGPHLHWTVRLAETRVDPLSLLEAVRLIL